jgi:hypothetical protein
LYFIFNFLFPIFFFHLFFKNVFPFCAIFFLQLIFTSLSPFDHVIAFWRQNRHLFSLRIFIASYSPFHFSLHFFRHDRTVRDHTSQTYVRPTNRISLLGGRIGVASRPRRKKSTLRTLPPRFLEVRSLSKTSGNLSNRLQSTSATANLIALNHR